MLLDRVGWDDGAQGLNGAPRIRVLAGAERHESLVIALRYLGLGAPLLDPGRRAGPGPAGRDPGPARRRGRGPRSSVCRPATCIPARSTRSRRSPPRAHEQGAWVHVDGAFGLWAAASPRLRALVARPRDGRLLGHGRAQDAQRALRLRRVGRGAPVGGAGRDGHTRGLPAAPCNRAGPVRRGSGDVAPGARRAGVGRVAVPRPVAGWLLSSMDLPRTPRPSRRESARSPAPRCSTTSNTPRSACPSATTPAPKRWHATADRRRRGLDVRLTVAGTRRAAYLGQQLVRPTLRMSRPRWMPYAERSKPLITDNGSFGYCRGCWA